MSPSLALFAVASDGSVLQWDGEAPFHGIMLRWLQHPSLSFPDYGYYLFRAPVLAPTETVWDSFAAEMEGKTEYEMGGGKVFRCAGGFRFDYSGGSAALVVAPGDPITVEFGQPVWYLSVVSAGGGSGIVATIGAGGIERDSQRLDSAGATATWRTRGIETLRLEGEGLLGTLYHRLLDGRREWDLLAHLSLPVIDPAYPAAPAGPSDEDVARSRAPAWVDWDGRYGPDFPALDERLRALATHRPLPSEHSMPGAGPGDPRLEVGGRQAVMLAALDPHLARAIGLAWDDDLAGYGLDGREWSYRLAGAWRGAWLKSPLDEGLELKLGGEPRIAGSEEAYELVLEVVGDAFEWEAIDGGGNVRKGQAPASQSPQKVAIAVEIAFEASLKEVKLRGSGSLRVVGSALFGRPETRQSILPGVFASDPGPPAAPGWIEAKPEQPAGAARPAQAGLRWDIPLTASEELPEGGCVLFQPASERLGGDPSTPAPSAPPFDPNRVLFDGDPVLVPTAIATAAPPQSFVLDSPLAPGWHAWWARGIDLFGRLSDPSPPHLARVEDVAPPPPPVLLMAEYAQAALSAEQAALRGRSSFATAWLADHPAEDAVVVAWAWTPELEALCPDVDGFRVHVRRPAGDGSWDGVDWGPEVASAGPLPVRLDGQIGACDPGVAGIAVTTVEPIDATHARCTTDLALDAGAGTLAGAVLKGGGAEYEVVGNGDGPNAVLAVGHSAGAAPAPGSFDLLAGATQLTSVAADIGLAPLGADPDRRRIAGVLVSNQKRLLVLGRRGATFVARLPDDPNATRPAAGAAVSWYPAYAFAVADAGFGPQPSPATPVARAQVTVRAVRRSASGPIASEPAKPVLLSAVDVTPPATPALPPIPTGERCAKLASAADWYGVSRFAFGWNPVPDAAGYVVYRAMGDAIWRADRAATRVGPGHVDHVFPESALPTDPGRRAGVIADLAALDAALRGGNEAAIAAAYDGLRADAQQLIAGQPAVEHAYVALTPSPLPASARGYEDKLDGKSDAHWFYRVAARSGSGVEGPKSPPTPPICCPDVVPPQAPRAHLALAGVEEVTLRWAPNAERDLAGYELLRGADAGQAAEVERMATVARLAPSPESTAAAGQELPKHAGALLEHADPAPGGREWLYRLVAVDRAGNRSAPSELLRARSLLADPDPPILDPPTRTANGIRLSWTHPNPRLACLVERRAAPGAGLWQAVTPHGWLPRGAYSFEDAPPAPEAAWQYRVRVKDASGRLAPTYPTVTVPAL